MPSQQIVRDYLKDKLFACKLDLKNGYFHIKIKEQYKKYMGFAWKGKRYRFNRMAFGLRNALFAFQLIMEYTLRNEDVLVYLDDILIASKTKEECILLRNKIISLLDNLHFIINHQKSIMEPRKQISYLGCFFNLTKHTSNIDISFVNRTIVMIKRLQIKHDDKLLERVTGKMSWISACNPLTRSWIGLAYGRRYVFSDAADKYGGGLNLTKNTVIQFDYSNWTKKHIAYKELHTAIHTIKSAADKSLVLIFTDSMLTLKNYIRSLKD